MDAQIKTIAVLGSSTSSNDAYDDDAQSLGETLAQNDYALLLPGDVDGVKGAASLGALYKQGAVSNVFSDPGSIGGQPHPKTTNDDLLSQRVMVDGPQGVKSSLFNRADVSVLLEGGLEELGHAMHLARKGQPLIVVNANGFYNGLEEQIDTLREEGASRNFFDADMPHVHVVDDVSEVLPILEVYKAQGVPQVDQDAKFREEKANDRAARPEREGDLPGFTHRQGMFILADEAGLLSLSRAANAMANEPYSPLTIDNSSGYYDGLVTQLNHYVEMGMEPQSAVESVFVTSSRDETQALSQGGRDQLHDLDEFAL